MLRARVLRSVCRKGVRQAVAVRCFSSGQLAAQTESESGVVVNEDNYQEITQKYRWERWVNDFPSILKKQAQQQCDQWRQKESKYVNSHEPSSVDFANWRKRIKTPGVVDLIEAEYKSHDLSDYGPYYFDNLTRDAKDELFDANDEHAEDVGFENILNGVELTNEQNREDLLEFAEERVNDAKNWLDELYQDREQHKARMDGLLVRTELMEMAEFPELARYCEELAYGEPNASRATPIFNYYYDEIFVDRRAEHANAIQNATMSRRQEEFEAFKEAYEELGFDVDLEALKESIVAEQNEANRDIEEKFYALTGEGEYFDPNTGRYYYEESGELVPNP